jgi:hypothetical protein
VRRSWSNGSIDTFERSGENRVLSVSTNRARRKMPSHLTSDGIERYFVELLAGENAVTRKSKRRKDVTA